MSDKLKELKAKVDAAFDAYIASDAVDAAAAADAYFIFAAALAAARAAAFAAANSYHEELAKQNTKEDES